MSEAQAPAVSPDELGEDATGAASEEAGKKKRAPAVQRPYPRRTIENALRVPVAIKEKNGGQPYASDQVAKAVNLGMSSNFYYLTAAARDFGFTEGTRDTATISLTPLGKKAVYPGSSTEKDEALKQAFFNVDIFRKVVEHYGGSTLPEAEFRNNTLITTFSIDESIVDEFVDLFEKNCRFLGIGTDYSASAGSQAGPGAVSDQTQSQSPIVSVARPSGNAPVCFVAMPFVERSDNHPIGFFDEVLAAVFKPAVEAAGFELRTAKRQGSDVIQSTIVTELLAADIVLADLTEHNPNVLSELGMRIAADRPVALVRAKGTGPIFDVDNLLRVEECSPNLWQSTLARDIGAITRHLQGAWEARDTGQSFLRILAPNVS